MAFRRLCERGWTESTEVFEKRNFFLSPKFFPSCQNMTLNRSVSWIQLFSFKLIDYLFPICGVEHDSTIAVFQRGPS